MSSQAVPSRPTLEFFPTAEGYYDYVGKKYVYQYKDHLGNIRLSYAKNPATQVLEIIEENNYYPFGLKHKGYNDYADNSNKYKFSGKELQDELGLNMYDYGARNYDPALGRWMNIDPLAEKKFDFTPYRYAYNNPLSFIDPDGMLEDDYGVDEDGNFQLLKKTDDKFDRVYAVDSKGNKKDTDGNKKVDEKDGVTVAKGIVNQMTEEKPIVRIDGDLFAPDYSVSDNNKGNAKDYSNLFKYVSDNTNVEFSLTFFNDNGKNKVELSTLHDGFGTFSPSSLGIKDPNKNVSAHYHSHPGIDGAYEMSSMSGDFQNAKGRKATYPNSIYFPNTSRLYNLTQEGIKTIKKINSSNDFKP